MANVPGMSARTDPATQMIGSTVGRAALIAAAIGAHHAFRPSSATRTIASRSNDGKTKSSKIAPGSMVSPARNTLPTDAITNLLSRGSVVKAQRSRMRGTSQAEEGLDCVCRTICCLLFCGVALLAPSVAAALH